MIGSNPSACEKEARVIKCARTGFWDADLQDHAASCPVCSEAASIARLLNEMRAEDQAGARIPDAGLMWRKAQFLATRDAGERATRPIRFVERFAYALGLVGMVGTCAWQWDTILGWLASFVTSGLKWGGASISASSAYLARIFDPATLQSTFSSGGSRLLVASGAGVLLLLVAFAAYLVHSEE